MGHAGACRSRSGEVWCLSRAEGVRILRKKYKTGLSERVMTRSEERKCTAEPESEVYLE